MRGDAATPPSDGSRKLSSTASDGADALFWRAGGLEEENVRSSTPRNKRKIRHQERALQRIKKRARNERKDKVYVTGQGTLPPRAFYLNLLNSFLSH